MDRYGLTYSLYRPQRVPTERGYAFFLVLVNIGDIFFLNGPNHNFHTYGAKYWFHVRLTCPENKYITANKYSRFCVYDIPSV